MEKPGIEPATPGLQGIALIHYTTGLLSNLLSLVDKTCRFKPLNALMEIIKSIIYYINFLKVKINMFYDFDLFL